MSLALHTGMRRKIAQFAEAQTRKNDSMHRMPHLRETARVAIRLARAEGADPDVCWASAMLHDICKSCSGDHGAAGAAKAAGFLLSLGMPPGFAGRVRDSIRFHNKGFKAGPPERCVLWDADKLPLLSPAGFRRRMLPFWIGKLGRKEGIRMSMREYRFYMKRLHTDSGRDFAKRHAGRMEILFQGLEKSNADL